MSEAVDVTIVGAGPTGLSLGMLLAKSGHRVVVLERHPAPYPLPRAVHLDGEGGRILQACGIGEELRSISQPGGAYEWRNANGEVLLRFDPPSSSRSGWPPSSFFDQPKLEAALLARAEAEPGVELRFGTELIAFTQDADGVTAELSGPEGPGSLRSTFLVGADGANSTVREHLGVEVEDEGFFFDWLVVDVALHEQRNFDPDNLQICDPARPTTAVSGGPGRRRWEFMCLPGEELEAMNDEAVAWRLLAPWDVHPANADLVRHAGYRFKASWATSWVEGRVVLAGDAAHQMPPFAGQGMCSGLRDAANLAWRLDLSLKGYPAGALLAGYASERIPHTAGVIAFAVELGKVICIPDAEEARARDELMVGSRGAAPQQEPSMPSIAEGTLLPSPGAGELSLQARIALGGVEGLLDDVLGLGWRLITVGSSASLGAELITWFTSIGGAVVDLGPSGQAEDVDGSYRAWLSGLDAHAALQRPDGYVFGSGREEAALLEALQAQLA